MKQVLLARTTLCAAAVALSGCYWLAQYSDLSSAFGDGGASGDAPSVGESGLVDEGPGQPFCPPDAGALAYCMDFDGVEAGALGLEAFEANVAIVDGTYVSRPSSLSVGLQGASSFGRYAVPFALQPTTTRLEFQVLAVDLDEGLTTLAIALLQGSTQTLRTLNLVMSPNGGFQIQEYFALADGGTQINAHPMLQVGTGTAPSWHHVVVTLTVNDGTKQYLSGLTVDNHVLEEGVPLALPWAEGSVSLHIGVTYAAAGGPDLFFDDIRADFSL